MHHGKTGAIIFTGMVVWAFLVIACPAAFGDQLLWSKETVSAANLSSPSDMAIDADNIKHILYGDVNNLVYIVNSADGTWTSTIIDTTIGRPEGSIAIGRLGNVHISYYYPDTDSLRYATSSNNFIPEDIDTGGNRVGLYSSLILDSNNNVHISYYDLNDSVLKYASNKGGAGWQLFVVDNDTVNDVGQYSSIALDSLDRAHISYYDKTSGALKYAVNDSVNWTLTTIDNDTDVGRYSSLAIDVIGNSHIAYYDFGNDRLKYATNASGAWVVSVVDDTAGVGEYCSLTLSAGGDTVFISYYDSNQDNLKVAVKQDAYPWTLLTVDSNNDVGKYTSIGINPYTDRPVISYYDDTHDELVVVKGWVYEGKDTFFGGGGSSCFIAATSPESDGPDNFLNTWTRKAAAFCRQLFFFGK